MGVNECSFTWFRQTKFQTPGHVTESEVLLASVLYSRLQTIRGAPYIAMGNSELDARRPVLYMHATASTDVSPTILVHHDLEL